MITIEEPVITIFDLECKLLDDKKQIGSIEFLYENDKTIYIESFYLDKEYRNKGIGTKIFNEFITKYITKEVQEINLTTTKDAIGFWSKLGFLLKNNENLMELKFKFS